MVTRTRKRDNADVTQYTIELRSKFNQKIRRLAAREGRSIRSMLALLLEHALEQTR